MASTIKSSNMTVTITESLALAGYAQGGTNSFIIEDIAEVNRRIITVPITEITIVSLSTAVAGGTFIESDVKYIRISNKDDTNHVGLIFKNEDNDEIGLKLDYGQSFIYNGDFAGGVVDTMEANAGAISTNTFADLVSITAIADTSPVDLEVFVAST